MDRLIGDAFGRGARQRENAGWVPAVDAVTENGDLVIKAELPGMKREDVDIAFHDGILTISGEHNEEEEKQDSRYLLRERRYGSFQRSMTLPQGVSEDDIKASFKEGVLEVIVEGAAAKVEEQPKRIEIEEQLSSTRKRAPVFKAGALSRALNLFF
jgi:HSP20 family protein